MYTFSPMMVANSRKHHCRVRSYTREVLVISTNLDIQKNHYPLDFRNRRGDEARIKNTWYNQGYCRDHMGEGATVPVKSHHTSTGAPLTLQPHLSPTLRSSIRQEIEVPRSSSPPHTNVADKAASTGVDIRYGGAATTVTGLEAGQGDLVVALDTDMTQTKKVYGATFTKLIKKVERLEKKDKLSKSRRKLILMGVSTASTDFTTANVPITTTGVKISTASPEVKIVGDSIDDIAAESLAYIRRSETKTKDKGKAIIEESESAMTKTKRKQEQERLGYEAALRLQEQLDSKERKRIARAHEVARIEADEDLAQRTVPKIAVRSTKRAAKEELKRLFKLDADDELWKSQKHIHDIRWRLYYTCGVHHVSIKDGMNIYMLVEREYPLSRGVLTQMLVAKLLVEQDNEMSRELLRKIFMQIERLRR
ncbi:hypothetical protein Tco_1154408 [Tanacetum coccineum]